MTRVHAVLLAVVSVLLIGSAGAVGAAVAGQNDVVRLCVTKSDGSVRVVNKGSCKGTEKLVVVNQEGVPGARGPAGATGARGPMGFIGPQGPPGDPQAVPVELPTYAGTWMLDVGGGVLQQVREVAGCNQPRFGEPPLPCRVKITGSLQPQTLAWMQEGIADVSNERNVALLQYDQSNSIVGRLGIDAARFTRMTISDLAVDGGGSAALFLEFSGDLVPGSPGGTVTPPGLNSSQQFSTSRFRLSVAGEAFDSITSVTDFVIENPGLDNDVSMSLTTVPANNGFQMFRTFSSDAAAGQPRIVKLELLNPARDASLLTFTASGGPLGYPSPFGEGAGNSESLPKLELDVLAHFVQVS